MAYQRKRDLAAMVMTVEEVSNYLRISKTTLYRLIKNQQVPYFHMGSDYCFNRETIDQWRQAPESAPPSRHPRR
jgi:excisionase family DNA binding protein